eukprot:1551280-Prymnesium_polylepis.1
MALASCAPVCAYSSRSCCYRGECASNHSQAWTPAHRALGKRVRNVERPNGSGLVGGGLDESVEAVAGGGLRAPVRGCRPRSGSRASRTPPPCLGGGVRAQWRVDLRSLRTGTRHLGVGAVGCFHVWKNARRNAAMDAEASEHARPFNVVSAHPPEEEEEARRGGGLLYLVRAMIRTASGHYLSAPKDAVTRTCITNA